MPATRRTIAAFLVPLLVALNAVCSCPHAVFASERSAVPADRGCNHADEAPSGGDHSPACPHCDDHGPAFLPSELSASAPLPAPLPAAFATSFALPALDVDRSLGFEMPGRAHAPGSVLEQICVLRI